METIIVNLVIGLAVLLFGAMAIFPLLVEAKPARRTPFAQDDLVISIQPVATTPHALRPAAPHGSGAGTLDAPGSDHRHAA